MLHINTRLWMCPYTHLRAWYIRTNGVICRYCRERDYISTSAHSDSPWWTGVTKKVCCFLPFKILAWGPVLMFSFCLCWSGSFFVCFILSLTCQYLLLLTVSLLSIFSCQRIWKCFPLSKWLACHCLISSAEDGSVCHGRQNLDECCFS